MSLKFTESEYASLISKRKGGRTIPATKYRNAPVTDAEGWHQSKKEAVRWRELGFMLRAGQVRWISRQVRFGLPGDTEYRADFVLGLLDGSVRVEDCKSPITRKLPAYRIKVRQLKALLGIVVHEV